MQLRLRRNAVRDYFFDPSLRVDCPHDSLVLFLMRNSVPLTKVGSGLLV